MAALASNAGPLPAHAPIPIYNPRKPMTDTVAEQQEQERLILDSVERFLEFAVKPHVRALEHDDIYPLEIVEQMKTMGLFGCLVAPEYGGLGLSTTTYAKIIERMSIVWMSIAGIVNSHVITRRSSCSMPPVSK